MNHSEKLNTSDFLKNRLFLILYNFPISQKFSDFIFELKFKYIYVIELQLVKVLT